MFSKNGSQNFRVDFSEGFSTPEGASGYENICLSRFYKRPGLNVSQAAEITERKVFILSEITAAAEFFHGFAVFFIKHFWKRTNIMSSQPKSFDLC